MLLSFCQRQIVVFAQFSGIEAFKGKIKSAISYFVIIEGNIVRIEHQFWYCINQFIDVVSK